MCNKSPTTEPSASPTLPAFWWNAPSKPATRTAIFQALAREGMETRVLEAIRPQVVQPALDAESYPTAAKRNLAPPMVSTHDRAGPTAAFEEFDPHGDRTGSVTSIVPPTSTMPCRPSLSTTRVPSTINFDPSSLSVNSVHTLLRGSRSCP